MGEAIEQLAHFIAGTPWEAIPGAVRDHAKLVFLDTVGVILAGSVQPEVAGARARLTATGGHGATILAPGAPRSDPRTTAFLNEQRWTVSHKATSLHAVLLGHGYAWFPDEAIRGELERGALAPVPLREGAERSGSLYLVFADRDAAGPGTLRLADIIRAKVREECTRASESAPT